MIARPVHRAFADGVIRMKRGELVTLHPLLAETAGEKMKGILGFTTDPVVSMDMKGDERSSIVDGLSTNVVGGNLVKVAAWYDNEWGYACRISDLCSFLVDKGI